MTPERLSFGTVKELPTVSESQGMVKFLRALGDIPVSTVTVCTKKKCVKGKKLQVKLDVVVGWWDGGRAMNMNWNPASKTPTVLDLHLVWIDDSFGNGFPFVANWNGKEWEDLDNNQIIVFPPVTHWMKIEPPTVKIIEKNDNPLR